MRWKPLVDCYRRHEAPGGILAVENARGLQSQTQPDETDSRPGRYLRHPYPAAERYIPSIVYIPLWLLILLSFLSHSFFLFSFDEIQRSGNATCIIKCGEKNMTGSRNNFVYPVMVLEVDGNFACSKFCLREEFWSTGGFQEVYDSVTLKNEKLELFRWIH